MHKRLVILGLLALFCFSSVSARADGETYVFNIDTKQKEKAKNRWSLSEWLETRDRMRMMDLWLALHSPSPYEFFLSGMYRSGSRDDGSYYGAWDASFAAYAYVTGLEVGWQTVAGQARWHALADLRLMGYHNQATNLTLQGGIKHESRGGNALWSPVAGLTLTVYVTKNFGINALYRHSFAPSRGSGGESGERLEGGAFIDFSFARVFGEYFKEVEVGNRAFSFSGIQIGSRLYF